MCATIKFTAISDSNDYHRDKDCWNTGDHLASIGELADKVDQLPEEGVIVPGAKEDEEERPLQETGTLYMVCGENVCQSE